MSRVKPYTLAGLHFATQAALEQEIRERLNAQPLNALFYDQLLAEVLNSLNAGVIASGQFANGWFRRLTWEAMLSHGISPPCEFEGVMLVAEFYPSGKWCDVSSRPWRADRGRHSNLGAVLTGKSAPRMEGAALDFEAEVR